MKKINPKMAVEMTLEDANYINELIERDKAKPMKEYEFASGDGSVAICPCCGKVISTAFPFCGWCGQHIDLENYEL